MADLPVSELSIWPHCLHRWRNMLLLILQEKCCIEIVSEDIWG